jgi:hypothetical protein
MVIGVTWNTSRYPRQEPHQPCEGASTAARAPFEGIAQPTMPSRRIILVINLKTAKALGLTLLATADQVIE